MLKIKQSESYGFIYLTINKINNKRYIGQKRFLPGWETYLGSGKIIKKAIKKYGENNFKRKILYIASSKVELDFAERLFISSRNAVKNKQYYNIHEGGSGGNTIAGYTTNELEEFKRKIRDSRPDMNGNNNPNFGNKWDREQRLKMSKKQKERFKNTPHPMLGKTGKNSPLYGRKHKGKTKDIISEKAKKKTIVIDTLKNRTHTFNSRELAREFINTTIRTLNNHLDKGTLIKDRYEVKSIDS